jgi:hypothetical protein
MSNWVNILMDKQGVIADYNMGNRFASFRTEKGIVQFRPPKAEYSPSIDFFSVRERGFQIFLVGIYPVLSDLMDYYKRETILFVFIKLN